MLKRYSFWEGLDCARCTFSRLLVVEPHWLRPGSFCAECCWYTGTQIRLFFPPRGVLPGTFDLLVLDVCLVTGASKEAGLGKVL